MEKPEKLKTLSQSEKEAIDQRREYHFQAIVQSRILQDMVESLEEADFEPEEVQELALALAALPEKEQKTALALPYEIRHRLFTRYHEQIASGALTPTEVVRDLLEKNTRRGYTLGYHLSPKLIPKTRGMDGVEIWAIRGTELDDRDNDRELSNSNIRMAYYSEDYLSRYKKKPGNYLYVVRGEIGEETSHKRDLNNRWGRAPSLSIISELDMRTVEKEIQDSLQKENAAAKAAAR